MYALTRLAARAQATTACSSSSTCKRGRYMQRTCEALGHSRYPVDLSALNSKLKVEIELKLNCISKLNQKCVNY